MTNGHVDGATAGGARGGAPSGDVGAPVMESPPGPSAVFDGRRYLYFAGTGYLGLQAHPEVVRAACDAAERYGIGSATSRAGFGATPPTLDAEREAAEFFGTDAAFYSPSAYAGNHILALCLEDSCDAVFVDEAAHYSVFEAARLIHRPVVRFRHRDPADLADRLRSDLPPSGRPLVVSDGVFSVRGTIAPVAEYHDVLSGYRGALVALDDAHALGVLGEHGRGTYEQAGLWGGVNVEVGPSPRLYLCGTFSKALGGYGGVVPGSRAFIESLKNTSPYYRGTNGPPSPVAAATARALQLLRADPGIRLRLRENVGLLKAGLRRIGLPADDTPVPIACLEPGDAENMRRIQRALADRGILIAYLPAYSGVGAEGVLRLAVFATHEPPMIERLLDELRQLL